ncbi:Uncharacterised protein [Mycobacteroides abscessus subsp. abscessus]|nr:Uncharacterised protein [Mycobacteroides abscessus subsp. abscessus]
MRGVDGGVTADAATGEYARDRQTPRADRVGEVQLRVHDAVE